MTSVISATTSRYEQVTTSRPWRHTVGRLSCTARVPVYIGACALQALKMVAKFFVSCFTLGQLWRCEKTRDWTFKGLARDGVMFLSLGQKAANSVWCSIFAPPKNYRSFGEAAKVSLQTVFAGKYHNDPRSGFLDEMPVKLAWQIFRENIPAYHKQIIQSECCQYATMGSFISGIPVKAG